jgi:hypothetical protein
LDLVAICPIFLLLFFFFYSNATTTRFFLDVRIKKGEGRVVTDLQPLSLLLLLRFSQLSCSFFFQYFFYDLLTFFVTFVFAFLPADASPFLLDFFLVAIIS